MLAREERELSELRELVSSRFGLSYADDKLDFLANVADKRRQANACASLPEYCELIASPGRGALELRALAEELTVTETFFFRSAEHFRVLKEVVVAAARERRQRRLRVLSAGCASGEEPYSLSICLREALPDLASWDVRILAMDMNRAMLEKAKRASYSAWSLRAAPDATKKRYFSERGREFQLLQSVREMVAFEERNLVEDAPGFWSSLACDAVFCRNVLMYFTPDVTRQVVARLTRALAPGGVLFLGHAETLRGLSDDYHLCHTHDTFYYRRRGAAELRTPGATTGLSELPQVVDSAASWVDAIRGASERISALAGAHAAAQSQPVEPPARDGQASTEVRSRGAQLQRVLDLMQRERFAEATDLLRALPAGEDPDALLLLCVLLTNQGALHEAELACRQLLSLDELHAGAHYLLALCREHAADPAGAREHDQSAIALDPGFSMPHLHLGLLEKRSGDRLAARRELGRALALLGSEEASRLLLFGGGFSRDALTLLCRAELSSLEVQS